MKVQFITQGCSANQADSEIMAGLLKRKGYEITDDAKTVVFNTCTVKGPTESFYRRKLKKLEEEGKKIIIAGCIPQAKGPLKDHSTVGNFQLEKIEEAIKETAKGNVVSFLERNHKSRLNLPKIRSRETIEIVPISDGCLSSCSFCKTKHARGNLYSYPEKDIVRHISNAVREGAKEIWLTSQDSSAYGLDNKTNLAELLKKIVEIPRDFRLRVGMANPDYFKSFLDEFIEVMKNEKIFKFCHIPVQSGNNSVLKDMKRNYTVEEYKRIVRKIKKEIPEINIATDIICGFPTETKEQFNDTLRLVKETRPDIINISRFWPRPGTPAARMEQIGGREIKKRTRLLTELFRKVAEENNKSWLGWKGKIWINEKRKNSSMLGRNFAYKQVVVPGTFKIGQELDVEVIDSTSFYLRAKILEKSISSV
ncbi:tRNA (N(6)-L-threonylcarbamoyladenosine(37)-C(2))-methylthiotransferase [Candidatus Woesearchaeota archaeon]|nr:tRNA (N(6)-L-threonylcarbamoyladenosine(37)-C(2))-methylthiotransferase [Candidatus Woesearchaeota archaeon]